MKQKNGLFVTGVDTGVGKTIVAGYLAATLKKDGVNVGVMKPVESGASLVNGKFIANDADYLKKMAGVNDSDEIICPYKFEKPVSPYHAAKDVGINIDMEKIVSAYQKLSDAHDLVIVEGAGGALAPLTKNMDMATIARLLKIPAIVVAHPYLGCINHTLMTIDALAAQGVEILAIVFNQYKNEPFNQHDLDFVEEKSGLDTFLLRYDEGMDHENDLKIFVSTLASEEKSDLQSDYERRDKEYVWHPFTQMADWVEAPAVIIESGDGVTVRDINGKEYIDLFASYWCNIHGHGEPQLGKALSKQYSKIAHSTFLGFSNVPAIDLAEKLVEISPPGLSKVFYSDNGSTAVEVGLKMAFQYWKQSEPETCRTKFLALGSAYHGDTVGAMSVGGVDIYHKLFREMLADTIFTPPPYCYRCPLGKRLDSCNLACADEVDRLLTENRGKVAAMVIEPIVQGPGGIITAPLGYLRKVSDYCKKHDVLLIADEVAVGFGRTGKMFATEHEDVTPDIMATSKSITGGLLPFAATLATDKIYDAFLGSYESLKTFFHGHTYTANQLGAAVALENIRLIEERDIVGKINDKAKKLSTLLKRFNELPHVGDIRQRGLIGGIELVKEKASKEAYDWKERVGMKVCEEALSRGLLVRPLGNVIVLFPAPVVTDEELTLMLNMLYDSIVKVTEA